MQLTDRDRALLGFVAEHRIVMADHAAGLIGSSVAAARGRLSQLTQAGLVRQRRLFHNQPGCYQVTRAGLAAIGSELPAPRIDLRCYGHDAGVAWLWLAARGGAFGASSEIISERRMRSIDGAADARDDGQSEPLGVRLGGSGPYGHQRRHYPDLLLIRGSRRLALELELSVKGSRRWERILSGYAADPRIDAVLYLTDRTAIGRSVRVAANRVGAGALVQVQHVGGSCLRQHLDASRAQERTLTRSAWR